MIMKQRCSGDKLWSKGKLFLNRALSVSKDGGECQIIGPRSDMRQVVSEVHREMETINQCFLGGGSAPTKKRESASIKTKLINNWEKKMYHVMLLNLPKTDDNMTFTHSATITSTNRPW